MPLNGPPNNVDPLADFGHLLYRGITEAILDRVKNQGVRGATGFASEFVLLLEEYADVEGGPGRKDIEDANRRLAAKAQAAALKAYQAKRSQSRTPSGYRKGTGKNDRLTGRLEKVIAAGDFTDSDARGISVGNLNKLNRQARHWARLNYGTEGAATKTNRIEFRFDNVQFAKFETRSKPRPKFKIPGPGKNGSTLGFFNADGAFYLGKPRGGTGKAVQWLRTAYIRNPVEPYYFIEAGLREAAKGFNGEYTQIVRGWLSKSGRRAANFTPGPGGGMAGAKRNPRPRR